MRALRPLFAIALAACASVSGQESSEEAPATTDRAHPPAGNAAPPSSGPAHDAGTHPPASTKSDLYSHAFGDPKNPAVVFLHGGPGATSYGFELTAGPAIAARGYHVIAYDQRGSGRSPKGSPADYSYAKSTQDLDDLIASLGLASPVLLAHSFGGSVAVHYLEAFPGRAKGVILCASPMRFPDTYLAVIEQSRARYGQIGNMPKARDMDALRAKMFPNGLSGPFTYSAGDIGTVIQAMEDTKIDYTSIPTADDLAFAATLALDPNAPALMRVATEVGDGYQANDKVGYASFLDMLGKHKDHAFGIYAPVEDLMFTPAHVDAIRANVRQLDTIQGASHFIYVDQADAFVDLVVKDLAALK